MNKYSKLKNYELEELFDLSKREKEVLGENIDPRTKHYFKLQELYLKSLKVDYKELEEEALSYVGHHEYLLPKEMISSFYEMLGYVAKDTKPDVSNKYFEKALQYRPSLYTVKHALYHAIEEQNIYMAARIVLIALEADVEFDNELSYYNLAVEHYFEDDIIVYASLMEEYKDEFISVDNITVEFSFNRLIAQYYIAKNLRKDNDKEELEAKKALNELVLKTIVSMKDEGELRSQVLRAREALYLIDSKQDFDIFKSITFKLLPKPSGEPEASPFNKL